MKTEDDGTLVRLLKVEDDDPMTRLDRGHEPDIIYEHFVNKYPKNKEGKYHVALTKSGVGLTWATWPKMADQVKSTPRSCVVCRI